MSTSPKALQPNTLLGNRFRIISLLAMGGQSVVYKAKDTEQDETVAVKMMRGPDDDSDETEACRQFRREYEVLAEGGPGLPRAVALLEHEGRPVVVEEWIEGVTLEGEGTHVAIERVIRIGLKVLEALEQLHARKPPVIVRDIKPSNLIARADEVFLIDLNSARALRTPRDTVALGTPGFAAPEQHSGMSETRSDLFSVGALLSYLLTGQDGTLTRLPCRPARVRGDVPPTLDAVVRKATQFEAERRYASASEMAAALRKALIEWQSPPAPVQGQGRGRRPLAKGGPAAGAPASAGPGAYPWSGSFAYRNTNVQVQAPAPSLLATFLVASAVGLTCRFGLWCTEYIGVLGLLFVLPWVASATFRSFLGQSWVPRRAAWLVGLAWAWLVFCPQWTSPRPQEPEAGRPHPVPVRTSVVPQVGAGALVVGEPGRANPTTLPRPRLASWGWNPAQADRAPSPTPPAGRMTWISPFVVTWWPTRPVLLVLDGKGTASQVTVPGNRIIDVAAIVSRQGPPSLAVATDGGLVTVELPSGSVTGSLDLREGLRARSLVSLWHAGRAGLEPSPPLGAVLHENGTVTLYDQRLQVMAQSAVPAQIASDPTARLHGAGTRLVVGGRSGYWMAPIPGMKQWLRLGLPDQSRPVPDNQGAGLFFVAPRHVAYLDASGRLMTTEALRDYAPRIIEAPQAMAYRNCRTDTNYGRQYLLADQGTLNSYRADVPSFHGPAGAPHWPPHFFWFRPVQGSFVAMAVDQGPAAPVGVLSQEGNDLRWEAWGSFGQKTDSAIMRLPEGVSRPLDTLITDQGVAVLYPEGIVLLRP